MAKDYIVYVDEQGVPTGQTAPKLQAHHSKTKLHLAFSCYLFDDNGNFLVTRRAFGKKVWPGVWTSSICGHPAQGEPMQSAIQRRLQDELGMKARDFTLVLPTYRYTTPPFNGVIENEFCPVFAARMSSPPRPNPKEVADLKWVAWEDFVDQTRRDTNDTFSWWCKDQTKQLKDHPVILQYARGKFV